MTFPTNILSATPAKYKFELRTETKTIVCDPEPLEWASGEVVVDRDLKVGGVFSLFQSDTLTFVGNGAKLLSELFATYELGAVCALHVFWWNSSLRVYKEFLNNFNIDFNFYRTVFVGKFGIGIMVKTANSSIKSKFENRKDIDVDLSKLVSIGETNILNFNNLRKYLNYEATNISYSANFAGETYYRLPRKPGAVSYTSVPAKITSSQYIETHDVPYVTKSAELWRIGAFFEHAAEDYTFDFSYDLTVTVYDKDNTTPWTIKLLEVDSVNTIISETTIGIFGDEKETINYKGTVEVSVSSGNSLKLVVIVQDVADIHATIKYISFSILHQIANTPAKKTEGLPIYEAFDRCTQLILDDQYPFYSAKFGRTDIQYDNSGNYYSTSNQLTYAHIQTGLNQRGLTLTDPNNPISISFNDLFEGANAIWNLGYGFETIGDNIRLRIEDYAYFFEDVEILDLSDRINKYDIVSEVMPSLVPIEIKSGFKNFEYLETNGRAEPNTTSQRTTIINTTSKYEIVSPLMGDTMSILNNLAEDANTTDAKGDNKIFIIKTQESGSEWIAEKDTNIQIVSGSLFGEDLLNRYFLPSRMVVRHGNRIKSGLRLFPNSYLRFQKQEKLNTLETIGEGYPIFENGDILVSSLDSPIYKPISHTVEVYFDDTDLDTFFSNPYGYFTFSDTVAGYVLNLKKKNNEAKAIITIIEKI